MLIQNSTVPAPQMPASIVPDAQAAQFVAPQSPQAVSPSTAAPAVASPSASAASQPAPSTAQLQSAIHSTNQAMSDKGLEFSVDATSKQTVVKLMDTKTGEVIGQFPSQQMIDISQAIGLMQQQLQQASLSKTSVQNVSGILIKQQA